MLPISFFERRNNAFFNSIAIIDADGTNLGLYRKSHIPDGPGYQEKFYFTPGDTGFKVFDTKFAKIGVAICWDQWFPEGARSMCLQGAEILFYPTAIGSEPETPGYHSGEHWERTMVGHSAASMVPVVASNRIGTETFAKSEITFYGTIHFYFHFHFHFLFRTYLVSGCLRYRSRDFLLLMFAFYLTVSPQARVSSRTTSAPCCTGRTAPRRPSWWPTCTSPPTPRSARSGASSGTEDPNCTAL